MKLEIFVYTKEQSEMAAAFLINWAATLPSAQAVKDNSEKTPAHLKEPVIEPEVPAPAPPPVAGDKAKRVRRPSEGRKTAAPSKAEAEEEFEDPPAPEAKEFTIDNVRAALKEYTEEHGIERGIELLAGYGAARVTELTPGQYGVFVEACAQK